MGRDGDVYQVCIGQLAEGVPGIADGCLVAIVKAGGEAGALHIEGLVGMGHLFGIVEAAGGAMGIKGCEDGGVWGVAVGSPGIRVEEANSDSNLFSLGGGGGE